jgi:glycosyltransferase involved in cell wall biosynthesis
MSNSTKTPLISVVIPAFNRASVVPNAIRSVLGQSLQDLEIIVVDDGSQDSTAEIILRWAQSEPRIRLIRNASNRGAQAARNSGIRAALGAWIAFLDSDDTWISNSLELRMAVARSRNVDVVHSGGFVVRFDRGERETLEIPALSGNVYHQLLRGAGPMFQGLLISAKALRAVNELDEAIVAYQEWDTAIRLAKRFKLAFVPEPTFIWDCRGTDTISKDLLRAARGYEQILRKHLRGIALQVGPRTVAEHYSRLSSEYRIAGDERASQRCKRTSYLWWPNLQAPLRRMRSYGQKLVTDGIHLAFEVRRHGANRRPRAEGARG